MKPNQSFDVDTLEPRKYFAATLIPGLTYETSIRTPGAAKNYSVTLEAGQNLMVVASDRNADANFTPSLRVIGPNNRTVRKSVSDAAFVSINATVAGTYRVRVQDDGRDARGSIKLTGFFHAPSITDSDDAQVAASGRRFAATMEPGDLDVWTINYTRGQFLSVLATENTAGDPLNIGMQLIDSSGRVIAGGDDAEGVKTDLTKNQRRIRSGVFYAVVYKGVSGASGNALVSGRYGLSIAQAPGAQYAGDPDTATPLVAGETRNGDLPDGDMDVWGINLQAGDTFSATLSRATEALNPELLLVSPTGVPLVLKNGATTTTLTYQVPTAGQYWLIGRDREGDTGGRFNIRYTV